jgi:hypothetical protein
MISSGVWLFALTRLPRCTRRLPARPVTGDRSFAVTQLQTGAIGYRAVGLYGCPCAFNGSPVCFEGSQQRVGSGPGLISPAIWKPLPVL